MPIAGQGLGCKIYFLFDFAVLKKTPITLMEVQVGLLESDPKKKPRADASGAHVFSATRPPQVHRQSEQPPRYKTSAFHSDSELIRNGKSSFLPTPLQKPGIMEPALKFRSLQGSIQSH